MRQNIKDSQSEKIKKITKSQWELKEEKSKLRTSDSHPPAPISRSRGGGKTRDPGNEVSKLPEARKSASDCDVTIAFSIESD